MASAIMTAIDQERYTIIDYRAMEALGEADADYYGLNMYLHQYLPTCGRLAVQAGVSLRTLIWHFGLGQRSTHQSKIGLTVDPSFHATP
jgi:hypothetical protein